MAGCFALRAGFDQKPKPPIGRTAAFGVSATGPGAGRETLTTVSSRGARCARGLAGCSATIFSFGLLAGAWATAGFLDAGCSATGCCLNAGCSATGGALGGGAQTPS